MKTEKRVIIYSRVSTTDQADHGYSLADQELRLEQFCKIRGYEIVLKIREDASAKTFDRPQFKIIEEYIKHSKGAVNLLLVVKWDRFSRNATDALGMIRTLLQFGIQVDAAEQPIDLTVPEQKILLAFYVSAPEVENDRRSMNTINGMRKANLEGRHLGHAPRGYMNARDNSGKPVILPDENSKFIKEAFELFSTGLYSQKEVLKELRAKGFKCSKSQFSDFLKNRIYTGKIFVKTYANEPEQWVNGLHQPIISEDLFFQVQEIITGRSAKTKKNKSKQLDENLPLRGFLECSYCGGKLTGSASRGNGGRYYYYHCNICSQERIRAEVVNAQLETMLGDIQITPVVKKLYCAMIKDLLKGDDADRVMKQRKREEEIIKQKERINKLTDLLADNQISSQDYLQAKNRYEDSIKNLNLEKNQMEFVETNFNEYLKWGFCLMEHIQEHYQKAKIEVKQQIISSIYPENMFFSNGELRTKRINELIVLFSTASKGLKKNKNGQHENFSKLSDNVPGTGIEPVQPQRPQDFKSFDFY